ncbi:MAG: rRNA maturation RNase YbeY [Patescibacteria group bacterium]
MISAEVNQSRLKGGKRLPARLVRQTLEAISNALRLKKDVTISVAFVSEPEMKKLNRIWRGKNRVTDVLSFELEEGEVFGEVLISYEQARRQAKDLGHTTRDELVFLLVHGVLHLFGYDHEKPLDVKKMFPLQSRILVALDVDPRL